VSTVLVVDDDPALVRALTLNLRARGYEVHAAATGAGALHMAAAHPPQAVVLDLGLPDLDGIEVIHGLRGWTAVPILVLSAREQQREKVAALDAGADDYVVKPFRLAGLLARVRALLRRMKRGTRMVPVTCPEESIFSAIWSCTWAALLEPPLASRATMRQPEALVRKAVTCPW